MSSTLTPSPTVSTVLLAKAKRCDVFTDRPETIASAMGDLAYVELTELRRCA